MFRYPKIEVMNKGIGRDGHTTIMGQTYIPKDASYMLAITKPSLPVVLPADIVKEQDRDCDSISVLADIARGFFRGGNISCGKNMLVQCSEYAESISNQDQKARIVEHIRLIAAENKLVIV